MPFARVTERRMGSGTLIGRWCNPIALSVAPDNASLRTSSGSMKKVAWACRTEARKIAGWCETHYIKIVPHNPLGPVSAAACLHLDLATDNFAVQEGGMVGRRVLEDIFPVQVPYERGCLLPPELPGLGVEFDSDAAEKHPFQWVHSPRLRRLDGSFTNW